MGRLGKANRTKANNKTVEEDWKVVAKYITENKILM